MLSPLVICCFIYSYRLYSLFCTVDSKREQSRARQREGTEKERERGRERQIEIDRVEKYKTRRSTLRAA